jgi:3-methylcrotonyl-CoA carboxylase alpha subunit
MPPPPFGRVLVANRGEIAVRVCRGLLELGIEPVAVFSDADRAAAHARAAKIAHPLGGQTARESYLDVEKILDAARATSCAAIHPGYGFLSENPAFARAVEAAGLTFIGPSAEAMERVGSKRSARAAAEEVGVPVVPGFHDDRGDDRALLAEARRIGFPLLLKASAGGGGKGMRLVEREGDFLDAAAAARREAAAAFGDDRLLLEKRVFPARHVEIQIFGDRGGRVVSLHERECSVQRRHQKILEEAPSPAVGAELRQAMGEAAVKLARHVGYQNAGTVEFLLDESGRFYFLEVNTRLQVEHPVTELVTGLDLVHLQVLLAAGGSLDDLLGDRDLRPRGHALEARIYAEDPEHGFLPAAGRLLRVVEPEGPGIRVDSGVYAGCEVPVHYDPLLAKLIVHAPDRAAACRRMARALAQVTYLGIPTNVDFLRRIVLDPDFAAGRLRTDFLEQKPELVRGPEELPPDRAYIAAALRQVLAAGNGTAAVARSDAPAGPWQSVGALRVWENAT